MERPFNKSWPPNNSSDILRTMKNKYVVIIQDNLTGVEQAVIRTKSEVKAMKKFLTFTIKEVYEVGNRVAKY
jgi:uncharacterized protein YbcI